MKLIGFYIIFCVCIPLNSMGQTVPGAVFSDTTSEIRVPARLIDIKIAESAKEEKDTSFDYEVFVNNSLKKQVFNYSVYRINDLLLTIMSNSSPTDLLQVILINPEHLFFDVKYNNENKISSDGEIILDFNKTDTTNYFLEIIPRKNLSFFYVENTDGIKNIRSIIGHIEDVTHSGDGFMIYYNGPGKPIIINNDRNLSTFFNALFTSTTQPPFPSEEFKKVSESLQMFIPASTTNMHLYLNFYIGQLSYNRLKSRFVVSLVEEFIASYEEMQYTVRIFTDFDVKEKEKGFEYINITKL